MIEPILYLLTPFVGSDTSISSLPIRLAWISEERTVLGTISYFFHILVLMVDLIGRIMDNLFSFVRADGSTMGDSLMAAIDTVRFSTVTY